MKKLSFIAFFQAAAIIALLINVSCAPGDDDDDSSGESANDDVNDDSSNDDDAQPESLTIQAVEPATAGASVETSITITGTGFSSGLQITVGDYAATDVIVISSTEVLAEFPAIPMNERGVKDVTVLLGGESDILPSAFEYLFDEDPIVFVHGYFVSVWEWNTMIRRFGDLGYPDTHLAAIKFTSSIQSNRINARDELPAFVDNVLAVTGAEKVDIIAHSMGGVSTRLWIKFFGGQDKVRDYVSLSGTHHGSIMACLIPWLGEGSREQCPAYAGEDESFNSVQWELNGSPDEDDVDETPFGVEDGGGIYWNALRTDADIFDVPNMSCCLNQKSRNDCSDPINILVHGVGHIERARAHGVCETARDLVGAHNTSKP